MVLQGLSRCLAVFGKRLGMDTGGEYLNFRHLFPLLGGSGDLVVGK